MSGKRGSNGTRYLDLTGFKYHVIMIVVAMELLNKTYNISGGSTYEQTRI